MSYGFIFDLDGLLIDTQLPFHALAESMIFDKYGLHLLPEEISERYAGISTRKIFSELLPNEKADDLVKEKWEIMSSLVKAKAPVALPGMFEVCQFLKAKQVPIIIASASPAFWIELCLDQLINNSEHNFREVFENNFVSAEECKNGKPAPDVFLLAKERLIKAGADEKIKWFVVGDGESDLMGGLAAEMDVLYLSSTNFNHDENERVKRFSDSVSLASYIRGIISS
ncbi:MAG: HAD family phosphatase [Candidatus Falkowbacteria bacterium]|nr:HAD family phosphatase [Candidatus Falkowbacteria bacterium]